MSDIKTDKDLILKHDNHSETKKLNGQSEADGTPARSGGDAAKKAKPQVPENALAEAKDMRVEVSITGITYKRNNVAKPVFFLCKETGGRKRDVRFTLKEKIRSRVVVDISKGDTFSLITYKGSGGILYGRNIRKVEGK